MTADGDKVHDDWTITRDGVRYGCHCDAGCDDEIDGCVIDTDHPTSCVYAVFKNGRYRSTQWTCKEWRPLPTKEALRRAANEAAGTTTKTEATG